MGGTTVTGIEKITKKHFFPLQIYFTSQTGFLLNIHHRNLPCLLWVLNKAPLLCEVEFHFHFFHFKESKEAISFWNPGKLKLVSVFEI